MWYELLSGKKLMGHQFFRQRSIDNYIVAFYCKELKLIIEIDGQSHEFDDAIEKDIERETKLKFLGFHIIRFTDWEVKNTLPEVQVVLRKKVENLEDLGGNHPL